MSKLDEILEYDVLAKMHGETRYLVKQQIKRLFTEILIDKTIEMSDQTYTYLLKRVEEL